MNFNPNYKYIGLDFETTGLDFTKDEPIQIGIVEIDPTGKIINEFSSLLKPTKDLSELKTIVGFITGINIEDIAKAPTPQDILPNIKQFFTENTVLIGHNIKFDLAFLHKFFPDLSYAESIDTFPLAQGVIHYQPSYALEVLVPGENAHNALQDTRNALILFQKVIERLELLQTKYPILSHFTSNPNFSLSKYLSNLSNPSNLSIKDIPKLNKIMGANTQPQPNEKTLSTSELENQKRYYLGNLNLKSFLERIIPNKKIILAFSNLQKLNIAKSMLNSMGIKNLGFLKDDQMIDYQKFENFLNKSTYTNEEIMFICKYYSHLEQGLGLLDLNTKSDYQIYHYIKNKKEKTRYPIVLATHQGLFSYVQDEINEYQDYETLFFDAERRYKSYNLFLSRPWDMYYTLNFIETLLYRQSLDAQTQNQRSNVPNPNVLESFYNSFQIFIGQLFMESKQLFTGNNADRIQSNPITTDSTFYKTNLLWKQIKESFPTLENEIEKSDFIIIKKQFDHIETLLNTVINIEKKMMNEDMYFVYSEHTKYTSWSEFIEIFPSNIYFFSNSDKTAINLFPDLQPQQSIKTTKIGLYDRILTYIQSNIPTHEPNSSNLSNPSNLSKSFFIASTRKEESKQIFETLYKNNLHNHYTIVAENITGGAGKNIFKLKNNNPKIIIGGYAFLLSIYAECISLDEIIIFNIRGNNEQSILNDIQWYANK
ncbi:MAG: 3'-5' exonuclease [Candidatus Absconditabacteria bacterium]|nr:3'-5' exonuclease [Candidatus Absconditabacteria bacterium]